MGKFSLLNVCQNNISFSRLTLWKIRKIKCYTVNRILLCYTHLCLKNCLMSIRYLISYVFFLLLISNLFFRCHISLYLVTLWTLQLSWNLHQILWESRCLIWPRYYNNWTTNKELLINLTNTNLGSDFYSRSFDCTNLFWKS